MHLENIKSCGEKHETHEIYFLHLKKIKSLILKYNKNATSQKMQRQSFCCVPKTHSSLTAWSLWHFLENIGLRYTGLTSEGKLFRVQALCSAGRDLVHFCIYTSSTTTPLSAGNVTCQLTGKHPAVRQLQDMVAFYFPAVKLQQNKKQRPLGLNVDQH